jgi:acetyltransferase
VPAIPDPNLTIRALGALGDYTRRRADALSDPFPAGRPMPADGLVDEPRTLAEHEARRYVVDAGVPVPAERLVASADDARAALRELGGPVAVKLSAPWLTHKSEHGAVRLDVATGDAAATAFTELAALAAGLRPAGGPDAVLVVQAMAPSGTELICGGFHDPTFGPVVTVGLGGTLVEIVRDRRLNLAPLPQDEAERMVHALAGGRLVGHPRGLTEAAVAAVAGTLVRLGELLCARPEVAEVELNPVICHGDDVTAVDALVSVREG